MKSKTSKYRFKARSSMYVKISKSMLEVSDDGYGESILAITTIWASAHEGKIGLIDGLSKTFLHTNGMILGWGLGKKHVFVRNNRKAIKINNWKECQNFKKT